MIVLGPQHLPALHVAGEGPDVAVGRPRHHLGRRAHLHEAAVLHDGDAVAELQRLRQVVGDEHRRLAQLPLQPDHLVLHVPPDQRVERGERLVEQQDLGVVGQGPGQADPLLHAAAELVRVGVAEAARARPGPACRRPARSRVALSLRCTSSPKATLSRRRRWGSSPKCWKTMLIFVRRSSRSRSGLAAVTSSPSISTLPAVGSIRRDRQRTSVDLPEPDRPMTTKSSPLADGERDVADGGHVADPGQLGPGRSARAEPTMRCGFRAEDLPDVAALQHRRARDPVARRATVPRARSPRRCRPQPGPRSPLLHAALQSCTGQAAAPPPSGPWRRRISPTTAGRMACRSPMTA